MNQANLMIIGNPTFCSSLAHDAGRNTGLHVTGVTTVAAARSMLGLGLPDTVLAIVDAGLPDGEAFDLCSDLVRAGHNVPVMMVGTGNSEAEAVRGLEAGAIDYFPRPSHRAELLARIRAHLRSLSTSLDVEISIGDVTFRPGQRTLVNRGTGARTWLTAKETKLLRCLVAANGATVPTATLIHAAWGATTTSMHTLHTHIYRLRTKLGGGKEGGPTLQTTRDGYSLAA